MGVAGAIRSGVVASGVNSTVTKLAMSDGTTRWQTPLPAGLTGGDITASADEIVVPGTSARTANRDEMSLPELRRTAAYGQPGGRICIMDKETGKVVQVLSPMEGPGGMVTSARWMEPTIIEGRVWVMTPQMVVGYVSKGE